jgi:hypothetical protein
MWHVQGSRGVHTGFWWLDLSGKRPLGRLGVDGRIILKWGFEKWDGWRGLD